MPYWLFKSEPDVFSFDDLIAKGDAGEEWDGVRNYQARNNMRAMALGDRAFFYHSNVGKEIVGICEVAREAYPDPTAPEGSPWVVCDFVAVAPLTKPVTLEDVKAEPKLKDMLLINNSRLSVQPVSDAEWKTVCAMGGVRP